MLVVVEEAKSRLGLMGVASDKVTIVENTVDIDDFTKYALDKSIMARFQDNFVILYIGGFGGSHRGLDTAILAMPRILEAVPNAKLLIVGEGGARGSLEAIARELMLGDRVELLRWQPFSKVQTFMALARVCLIPHRSSPHTEATSPHKLYQGMLMGIPLVVSSCRPLRRVVEETRCGLVFKAGDSADLAHTIIHLSEDEHLRHRMGKAGRRWAIARYNWKRTSRKLLKVYDQLGERTGEAPNHA